MARAAFFTPDLFAFLAELRLNNERDWFVERRARYESSVKNPVTSFVSAFAAPLARISRHYRADPKPTGGSIFRINRDVRFSPDKSPYKTQAAMIFFHEAGRDRTPVFYLHLEPGDSFLAGGLYRPEPKVAAQVRKAIAAKSAAWKRATRLGSSARLGGEQLKRPPPGFDSEHPLIEDLRRKDFILMAKLKEKEVCAPAFLDQVAELCHQVAPLNRFLCRTLGLPF